MRSTTSARGTNGGSGKNPSLEKLLIDFALWVAPLLEIQDGAQAHRGRRRQSWNWAERRFGMKTATSRVRSALTAPAEGAAFATGEICLLIAIRAC